MSARCRSASARRLARALFRCRYLGALATIGWKIAIADFAGGLQLRGFIERLTYSLEHIYLLIGFRNRFSVALDWAGAI